MYKFGPFPITPSQIFFTSKHSFGLVNLKPVVKGHVLIIPRKNVAKFCDLDEIQISDLFKSTHIISSVLQKLHKAGSLTITIQDGPDAGQTVPHVHVHVMPRFKGDYLNNGLLTIIADDIYGDINLKEKEMAQHMKGGCDANRVARSESEMSKEAAELRHLFSQFENIWD